MAEEVLPVLRPDDDGVFARRVPLGSPGEVLPVGDVVAGLRREQVDERHVLRGGLQERGGRRDVVDVRVRGQPAVAAEVDRALEVERQLASIGSDVEPRPERPVVEALDRLHVHRAEREVDLERAGDIGIGVRTEQDVGPAVLHEARVDLVAMPERREVPTVGRHEPDPGRCRIPIRGDAHVDPDARRGQRPDHGSMAGRGSRPVELREGQLPVADPDLRIRRRGEVDDGRLAGRVSRRNPRPAPADRPAIARAAAIRRRPGRWERADGHPEVDAGQLASGPLDPELPTRRRDERIRGPVEHGHGRQDDGRARAAVAQRDEPEAQRHLAGRERDRVEPVGDVVVRGRDEVGDARLRGTPRGGEHPERPGVPGGRVAARGLDGVRAAPVHRRIRPMPNRFEGQEPPADDPVRDLEPAAHRDRPGSAVGERQLVGRERLAGREHPAHGHAGRPVPGGVPPAVGEVGHDDVAGCRDGAAGRAGMASRASGAGRRRSIVTAWSSSTQRRAAERGASAKGRPRNTAGPLGSRSSAGPYCGWSRPATSPSPAFHVAPRSTVRARGVAGETRCSVIGAILDLGPC